jgi:prepilin-type N-terminal cleavage/methylation domain-containing protein
MSALVKTWSPRRSAFTLLELLVVVVLITVLLCILVPSLGRAIRQAEDTVCMHNLKEVYQSLQVYRLDHDGWIPISDGQAGQALPNSWFGKLYPHYLHDPELLRCPADPMQPGLTDFAHVSGSSYGLSDFLQSSPQGFLANLDRRQPRRPMDTLLIADVGPDATYAAAGANLGPWVAHRTSGRLPWDDSFSEGNSEVVLPWLTSRHSGSINTVTLGGSLRRVPTLDLMGGTILTYYATCAAGDCPLCTELHMPHYSFAHAGTFWWTGPVPQP